MFLKTRRADFPALHFFCDWVPTRDFSLDLQFPLENSPSIFALTPPPKKKRIHSFGCFCCVVFLLSLRFFFWTLASSFNRKLVPVSLRFFFFCFCFLLLFFWSRSSKTNPRLLCLYRPVFLCVSNTVGRLLSLFSTLNTFTFKTKCLPITSLCRATSEQFVIKNP